MIRVLALLATALLCSNNLSAEDRAGRVPDEFESDGGHALGLGNSGVAAMTDQSSVKANPAMLAFEKQYTVAAGYHWPSAGREFYQAGIVDSQTAQFAAGVTYTSSAEKYADYRSPEQAESQSEALYDSPISRRVAVGLGKAYDKVALGLGVQMVTLADDFGPLHGTTIAVGMAGLLVPSLRFAVSAENLANRKVHDYAPRTYRGGLAYTMLGGDVTAHVDYRQRQRVYLEMVTVADAPTLRPSQLDAPENYERMTVLSFSVRIQSMLRLLGAYGHELGGSRRRTASGGVALINKGFSLSYLLSRPYLSESKLHQAVNLGLVVSL